MNNYIPTKKDLYISISAAFLGLVLLVCSVLIIASKISSIKKELSIVEATSVGSEETFLIKKDLVNFDAEISLLNSFFVNPGQEVKFIEKLEEVAKSSGVKIEINSILVSKKATSTDIVENLNAKAIFEGEWGEIVKFLKSVEQIPYAISIGNVGLDFMGNSLWKGEADISVLKIKDL